MSSASLIYIGSYTTGTGTEGAAGITCWRQDLDTGQLEQAHPPAGAVDPSFLAIHPDGRHLYAVSESAGEVLSFAVADDGSLIALGATSTGGVDPCHLIVDPTGRHVVVANYGDGSVAVHPIGADGALGAYSDLARHSGGGPNPQRQQGPHAHMATFTPAGDRILVTDLGTDAIHPYIMDGLGHLRPAPPIPVGSGTGPRHLAYNPDGFVYVAGELDSQVVICRVEEGELRPIGRLPATVSSPNEANYPSHIECSPDARFVYVANRGADCLSVFAVAGATLKPVADVPTGGRRPRHFAAVGGFIYVANQHSGTVTVLRRDPATGVPVLTGHQVSVPAASCVLG